MTSRHGRHPISPNSAAYSANPLLNSTLGNNWVAGNYKNGRGKYDVYEGFLELNLPLFDRCGIGRAKLNGSMFKVDNLFDRASEPAPQTNTGPDVNPALHDTVGRIYRLGVRARF